MDMDMTAAPDAQLIPQLQDTNIQINRLMVQQLNQLSDTIKQLQLTDVANFRQDPSIQSRTQQLQALLPIMKTALEHQQAFYHQCLKLRVALGQPKRPPPPLPQQQPATTPPPNWWPTTPPPAQAPHSCPPPQAFYSHPTVVVF